MNPQLPNSIRNVLASQPVDEPHPSADLLTAFAEQTLSTGETARIADHLSCCTECREVVFLASSVDEQPTAPEQAAIEAASKPRSWWTPRLAWMATAAAALGI